MSYCAPGKGDHKTCFTKKQLVKIATAYNKEIAQTKEDRINIRKNKYEIWQQIGHRLSDTCGHEHCWVDQGFVRKLKDKEMLEHTFRPKRPLGKYQWLTTSNIHDVMRQYERSHKDFMFLGAVPIDFCTVMNEICTLNIGKLYQDGIRKIGIVFNTDPSTKSGKHWISMFVNLNRRTINFFDSYAVCPPPNQVLRLINHVKSFSKVIYGRDNAFTVNCNNIKHQFANSECGVYSIYFLTESLKNRTFQDITMNIKRDEEMNQYRQIYFTPQKR